LCISLLINTQVLVGKVLAKIHKNTFKFSQLFCVDKEQRDMTKLSGSILSLFIFNREHNKALYCSDGEVLCLPGFNPCSPSERISAYSQ
jgi:hypothetical protein